MPPTPPPPAALPRPACTTWVVLAVATLVVFASLGARPASATMLLPPMQAGLGLDNAQAGALATASLRRASRWRSSAGRSPRASDPAMVMAILAVAALGMLLWDSPRLRGSHGLARARASASRASNVPVMALLSGWFGRGAGDSPPA